MEIFRQLLFSLFLNPYLRILNKSDTLVIVDPFNVGYLPPLSDLLIWRAHLGSFGHDQKPYIATNYGNFDLEAVRNAILLHDAKSIKECVFQETSWFQNPPNRPMSVSEYPTNILLDRYQHLILNTPHNMFVENLSMKPGELAQLAHTRYISSDHVEWFIHKLNSQQNNSLCVYLMVCGIQKSICQIISNNKPTSPLYLMLVDLEMVMSSWPVICVQDVIGL